jgi:hypothetical protein
VAPVEGTEDHRQTLAQRLKTLREEHWPGLGLTQQQLARALAGGKKLSIASISSYENPDKPVPPTSRLSAYATFFATPRSWESEPYRVLPVTELTAEERNVREALLQELLGLRNAALLHNPAAAPTPVTSPGLWSFPEKQDVTIVCAQLPLDLRQDFTYANPESPDYVSLYTYADLDALLELHGHVRATNPTNLVTFKAAAKDVKADDYTSNLVVLGGTDWNFLTEKLHRLINLPIKSLPRETEDDPGGFQAGDRLFVPKLEEGEQGKQLTEDVALFYRGPSPFNVKRTVTICYGMYGRGTYGVVRALTDGRFRDRNEDYLRERFDTSRPFSIVSRVKVVETEVLTPDWTLPESRLYEWAEDTSEHVARRGTV